MVSGLRGYLLTNEAYFIQTYDSAILENESILQELLQLSQEGSKQKELLKDIHKLNEYWVTESVAPLLEAKKIAVVSDSSMAAFNKLYRDRMRTGLEQDILRKIQSKFSEFSNYEYGLRDLQKDALTESIQNTDRISFYLTLISVVVGSIIAIFISYYISSRIVKMVNMANAIAHGNYDVHMADVGNSELSQLAKALNEMARILNQNISLLKKQKNELDQFAHIVSHDLKTPLRGIDNVVTWIEEDHSVDIPPKVHEYLSIIKGRITRAENLLKGILLYARIGKDVRAKETVDVNELLIEIKEYGHNKPGINLIIEPKLPILYTEKTPLLQIFTNLIVNAFKYHDKNEGFVKVYHRITGEFYEFFIEDNGPGIAPQYHEKIFVIFQTLQEKEMLDSTGVGLAIVKKIIDDLNLKINIKSESGKGSVFSFTWPITK
jgi:signal transduction histidine kinase